MTEPTPQGRCRPASFKDRAGYRPAFRDGAGNRFIVARTVIEVQLGLRRETYPTRAEADKDAADYLEAGR